MMKAAYYESVGPASDVIRVGDRPTPQPGPGEVRVRIHASGVNPSDVKSRAGLGERVWTWNAAWRRPCGTCAEYVCLPLEQVEPLPSSTDFAAGACLGIPAMTACHATLGDGPVSGQTVLVTGGAGAVGHYAIQ